MMKKMGNNNSESNNGGVPNKKERHIVSWSQEEDDILREQIRLHGTENWAVIASKFKDKSTRQCRRRWFTYLNSDFKKGGWSPEEDMLLCEAQRLYGNRWTEIAKVVSGRTDNAVKNRFTTLCKKRAKEEAMAKENINASCINLYNKRVVSSDGFENSVPLKQMRTLNAAENQEEKLSDQSGVADNICRRPFAVVTHNNVPSSDVSFPDQLLVCKETAMDRSGNTKTQGTFLKKDDPKLLALVQQAELLTSLASKVKLEKKTTDQSLESAWMVIQNHLKQNRESDLVQHLRSCNEGSLTSWRESEMSQSSPCSSEFSTASTVVPCNKPEESQTQIRVMEQNINGHELRPNRFETQQCLAQETGCTNEENNTPIGEDSKGNNGEPRDYAMAEFSSPLHVTPMFRALAAAIPSPKFSESEKHFLMKTLGMDSPSSAPRADPSRPPQCKRSLLHCL